MKRHSNDEETLMPTLPKPGELAAAMKDAASGIINKDIQTISGFSKDQLQRIERLAIDFSEMVAAGEFRDDPEAQADYLGILEDLSKNFVRTLQGLATITIEKIWNAVVKVLWTAIDKATGLTFPKPTWV